MICWGCNRADKAVLGGDLLCPVCRDQLEVDPSETTGGRSLYLYKSLLRSFILRVKIQGDYQTLAGLCRLFVSSPVCQESLRWAGQIVPVPSSLWGRLRGRFDLAWQLASEAARDSGLPLRVARRELYWQGKKRAVQEGRYLCELNLEGGKGTIPTLIIDDVVTTGYSISRLAASMPAAKCRFLTLGTALRHRIQDNRRGWQGDIYGTR